MSEPVRDPVDALAAGYRGAQILFTAVRLGLIAAVGRAERTADEVAEAAATDPRATRILLDALVALDLLEKRDGRYQAGPAAREHLLPDSPSPRSAILFHDAELYERWARLDDALRTGGPVPPDVVHPRLARDPRRFAAAMADIGRESALRVVAALSDAGHLAGIGSAVDLGGGPGLYAIALARAVEGLRAVVVDREETLEVARENVRAAGLENRVTTRAADLLVDDLGGPYDLALCSNVVHGMGPEDCRTLVARATAALAPGGLLAVKDFLLEPDRTDPPGAALFAVNMLVNTDRGDCYTLEEVGGWMASAGLEPAGLLDLTPLSRLALGRRP